MANTRHRTIRIDDELWQAARDTLTRVNESHAYCEGTVPDLSAVIRGLLDAFVAETIEIHGDGCTWGDGGL